MKTTKRNIFFVLVMVLALRNVLSATFASVWPIVFATNDIDLNAKAYYLFDVNTESIIAEKDCHKHYEVASMVKLMTSLLSMEKIEKSEWTLENELTVSEYAPES